MSRRRSLFCEPSVEIKCSTAAFSFVSSLSLSLSPSLFSGSPLIISAQGEQAPLFVVPLRRRRPRSRTGNARSSRRALSRAWSLVFLRLFAFFPLLLRASLITRERLALLMCRESNDVDSSNNWLTRSASREREREREQRKESLQSSPFKTSEKECCRLAKKKKKGKHLAAHCLSFPRPSFRPFVFPLRLFKLPSLHDQRRGPGRRPLHPAQVVSTPPPVGASRRSSLSFEREGRRD